MASPNISEIVTTTIQSRSRKLADNVSKNTALLYRLKERGNVRPADGGEVILQELEYAENGTFMFYSGYETLNISPSDVMTSASFDWKQASTAVTISGLEKLKNSGKAKMIDLLSSRIKNAEKTMVNKLSEAVYSDGTAFSGKQIGGLQLLVPDDPTTGTVGGINRANWTFWRPQLCDFSVETLTPGSADIQKAMNILWLRCVRNNDKPDLIVSDNTYFRYYLESLQANQRFTNQKLADAGFDNLRYMSADVVFDGGLGGAAPSNHMWFLNTDYIHYRPHRDQDMVPLDPDRFATNQDAVVKLIGWAGNMTLSNAQLQGVLIA